MKRAVIAAALLAALTAHATTPAPPPSSTSSAAAESSAFGGEGGAGGDATGTGIGLGGAAAGGNSSTSTGGARALGLSFGRSPTATAALPGGCPHVKIVQTVSGGWGWGFTPDNSSGTSDPVLCALWHAYAEAKANCWEGRADALFAAFVNTSTGRETIAVREGLKDEDCKVVKPTPPAPQAAAAPVKADPLKGKRVKYRWVRKAPAGPTVEKQVYLPDGTLVTFFLKRDVK